MGRNKYRAKKVEIDGLVFASQLEASVYTLLKSRENANEISILQLQDRVYLTEADIPYVADFRCVYKATNTVFWVEAKGVNTPTWNIKKKLWAYYGPGHLEIYKGTYLRPYLHEIIKPFKP